MKCSAYFGELSKERKREWKYNDNNPYAVLQNPVDLGRKGYDLWEKGDSYFSDRIQIDWGSYAWKCTDKQVIDFLEETQTTLSWLIDKEKEQIRCIRQYIKEHRDTEYGIVFIEDV